MSDTKTNSNENELIKHEGYFAIARPGEIEPEFIKIVFDESEDGTNKLVRHLVKVITGEEKGRITNLGYLPSPVENMTAFVDFDQFNPDTKFNFSLFGNPIFGNMVFLQVDLNTEGGKIIPIEEEFKNRVTDFVCHFKKFEKESGIYDAITNTDKIKFLEEFAKEKNSVMEEATKDIEGEHSEELKEAKELLKNTLEENNITEEEANKLSESEE